MKTDDKEYDPFNVLNIDREAFISEIKRTYHELSKKHHPDRGGDPEKFKQIAKAYRTLTNEEAKENWRKYGNPDGRRELHVGIAIPKWIVEDENSIFVLSVYTSFFLIIFPAIVVCFLR